MTKVAIKRKIDSLIKSQNTESVYKVLLSLVSPQWEEVNRIC